MSRTVDERYWAFVHKTEGCWLWTGALGSGGYAVFSISHRNQVYAHRYSYEQALGPIPTDRPYLDHVFEWGCLNRHCVRPSHLEPVTQAENNRRAAARKTHCPQGHEYTDETTYRTREGWRMCRICMKAHAKKRNAKLKAERLARRLAH